MRLRRLLDLVAILLISWLSICLYDYIQMKRDPGRCHMTYMWPNYVQVDLPKLKGPYSLHRYVESQYSYVHKKDIAFDDLEESLDTWPVLFLPGSGGHYRQVRSLASECARRERQIGRRMFDWYAIHFNEEKSAFDGRIMSRQLDFALAAARVVLDLHEGKGRDGRLVLVGHSMGGAIAQAMVNKVHTDQDFRIGALITLATPHAKPPLTWQPAMSRFYQKLDPLVSHASLSEFLFLSVAAGYRDELIHETLTKIKYHIPNSAVQLNAETMKGVTLSPDHKSILWCNQLVKALTLVLEELQVDVLSGAHHPSSFASKVRHQFSMPIRQTTKQDYPTHWRKTYMLLQENYGRIPSVLVLYSLLHDLLARDCLNHLSQSKACNIPFSWELSNIGIAVIAASAVEPGCTLLAALGYYVLQLAKGRLCARSAWACVKIDTICLFTLLPSTLAWLEKPSFQPHIGDMLLTFVLVQHVLLVAAGYLREYKKSAPSICSHMLLIAYVVYALWRDESYRIFHVGTASALVDAYHCLSHSGGKHDSKVHSL